MKIESDGAKTNFCLQSSHENFTASDYVNVASDEVREQGTFSIKTKDIVGFELSALPDGETLLQITDLNGLSIMEMIVDKVENFDILVKIVFDTFRGGRELTKSGNFKL
jgi:hypothetical protein